MDTFFWCMKEKRYTDVLFAKLLKLVNRRGLLNIKSEQKTCEGCVRNLIKNRGLKGHFHLCISLSTTGNYVFKHFSRIPFWSQNLQGMKSNYVLMKFVDMFFQDLQMQQILSSFFTFEIQQNIILVDMCLNPFLHCSHLKYIRISFGSQNLHIMKRKFCVNEVFCYYF